MPAHRSPQRSPLARALRERVPPTIPRVALNILCGAAFVVGAASSRALLPQTSSLPATPATALPAPLAAAPLRSPVARRPERAEVTYAAGLLDVRANNSSLNSILRDIGRKTGMNIQGGVADQRVFGHYGPADPSTVLTTLLDGTGTNLLLRETAADAPAELILTPRNGGPTPPNPNAPGFEDEDPAASPAPGAAPANQPGIGSAPPPGSASTPPPAGSSAARPSTALPGYAQRPLPATAQAPPLPISGAAGTAPSGPQPISQPFDNTVLGSPNATTPTASTLPVANSVSTDSLRTPSTVTPVSGIVDSPSPPPAGSTTANFGAAANANAGSPTTPTNDADTTGSNTPGGANIGPTPPAAVKTPEEIYQQLQQLRQAAQAQGSSSGQSGAGTTAPQTAAPTTTPPPPQSPL